MMSFTRIKNYIDQNQKQIFTLAREGFAEKGRGHIILFCVDNEATGHKAGEMRYITQSENDVHMNHTAVKTKADREVKKYMDEYRPQREMVLCAYFGNDYIALKLSANPKYNN